MLFPRTLKKLDSVEKLISYSFKDIFKTLEYIQEQKNSNSNTFKKENNTQKNIQKNKNKRRKR